MNVYLYVVLGGFVLLYLKYIEPVLSSWLNEMSLSSGIDSFLYCVVFLAYLGGVFLLLHKLGFHFTVSENVPD